MGVQEHALGPGVQTIGVCVVPSNRVTEVGAVHSQLVPAARQGSHQNFGGRTAAHQPPTQDQNLRAGTQWLTFEIGGLLKKV